MTSVYQSIHSIYHWFFRIPLVFFLQFSPIASPTKMKCGWFVSMSRAHWMVMQSIRIDMFRQNSYKLKSRHHRIAAPTRQRCLLNMLLWIVSVAINLHWSDEAFARTNTSLFWQKCQHTPMRNVKEREWFALSAALCATKTNEYWSRRCDMSNCHWKLYNTMFILLSD